MMHVACWFRLIDFLFRLQSTFRQLIFANLDEFLCGIFNATTQSWISTLLYSWFWYVPGISGSGDHKQLDDYTDIIILRSFALACYISSTEHSSFVLFLFGHVSYDCIFWHFGWFMSLSLSFKIGVFRFLYLQYLLSFAVLSSLCVWKLPRFRVMLLMPYTACIDWLVTVDMYNVY